MSGGIFISYRRDDARQAAGRLADDLSDHFGASNIFRDIEGIELGVDFVDALNRALEICVVMLVLIGPRWLDIRDAAGKRRLDDPKDWIRQEISTALQRGIRVVPVLVDGTPLPDEQDLPADLCPLVRRQALEIADNRWRGDMQRLVETLARVPGLALEKRQQPVGAMASAPTAAPPAAPVTAPVSVEKPAGRRWGLYVGIGLAVLVVGYVVDEFSGSSGDGGMPWVAPQPNTTPIPVPVPVPVPAPVQQQAVRPNLNGTWRTIDGETYQISQQGNQFSLTAHAGGQQVGSGQGQIDGNLMRLTLTMVINGVPLASASCNMQASPDFNRYAGACEGPGGQFMAQMFR
jgi:hypothetical protein